LTQTSQPVKTDTPSPTETIIPPTLTLDIGSTMISEKDSMILLYVPAGEFTMGSDDGEADEKLVHEVTLDAFWIDRSEVTTRCIARACKQDLVRSQRVLIQGGVPRILIILNLKITPLSL
jgi:formylglycine-generating enzyme required for sulfatase activity